MKKTLLATLFAFLIAASAHADDLTSGTWSLLGPGGVVTMDLDSEGRGQMVVGGEGPVTLVFDGDRMVMRHPGRDTVYTIKSRRRQDIILFDEAAQQNAQLMLVQERPVTAVAPVPAAPAPAVPPPAQSPSDPAPAGSLGGLFQSMLEAGQSATDSPPATTPSQPADAQPAPTPEPEAAAQPDAARDPLVGSWINRDGGNERVMVLQADGLLMLTNEDAGVVRGGRWWREGDALMARLNERSGFMAYLSRPIRDEIVDVSAGSLTLNEPEPTTYMRLRDGHVYGPPDELNFRSLVGRYLVVKSNGDREIWDFDVSGKLYVNRPTEFVAYDWSVADGKLLIDAIFRDIKWILADFQRGAGFAVPWSDGGADVFYYMDGPHWAPPADLPMPTLAQRERALAQELAITSKSFATSSALNSATAQMGQMMDMMADDIADRPYRYEWVPR